MTLIIISDDKMCDNKFIILKEKDIILSQTAKYNFSRYLIDNSGKRRRNDYCNYFFSLLDDYRKKSIIHDDINEGCRWFIYGR